MCVRVRACLSLSLCARARAHARVDLVNHGLWQRTEPAEGGTGATDGSNQGRVRQLHSRLGLNLRLGPRLRRYPANAVVPVCVCVCVCARASTHTRAQRVEVVGC